MKRDTFDRRRLEQNRRILDTGFPGFKRFFALDAAAYAEGALTAREKELMGLVASTVLRCNDCIHYHLLRCIDAGVRAAEIHEALNVAMIVGGSITIPHLRYAFEVLEEACPPGGGDTDPAPQRPGADG
jgi:AhpD family alkylhydroperoxidase